MKIGLSASDIKRTGTDNLFAKIAKHGFASTQFGFAYITESDFEPDGQIELPEKIDDSLISLIKKSSEKYNVDIFATYGTFNMAHPDFEVRKEGIKRFEVIAKATKKLDCKYILLCSGTRYKDYLWRCHQDNATKEAWEDMIDTVKKCAEIAEKYNVVAAVETEASNIIDTPEKARKMMDEVGSENLKMTMDCANLFHAGDAKKENVEKIINHAFDVFGDDIVIAHGKDILESDGIKFCPTGEGIIDFKQFIGLLNKYNYKGDMILHGIFDENKMAYAYDVIKNAMVN